MPVVEVSDVVNRPAEEVYGRLSAMDKFPEIMANVQSVTILESGPGYTISEWVAKLQGRRLRWVERDQFYPERLLITFHQVEGDLKVFQGEWRVEERPDGCQVSLSTEFEFGMPMLASLLNPVARYALRQNALSMLRGIQQATGGAAPVD